MTDPKIPYDVNAERMLLAAILMAPHEITTVRDIVSGSDFFLHKNELVYMAMLRCVERRSPPDLSTVADELRSRGELKIVGDIAYLSELVAEHALSLQFPNISEYATIIARLAARRRIIQFSGEIAAAAYDDRNSLEELQARAANMIEIQRRATGGPTEWKRRIESASDLWRANIPPIEFVIDQLLPVGSTVLHAPPKSKKSWMAADMALAVASGGMALGHFRARRSGVLYIDLENSRQINHERLHVLCPESPPPADFNYVYEWPSLGEGFFEELTTYLEAHPFTRLVIVDTLVRARPMSSYSQNVYAGDATFMQPMTRFAHEKKIAMLIVHHSRKGARGASAVDSMSGSYGLSGSVDNIVAIAPDDNTSAQLVAEGRTLRWDNLSLKWDMTLARWSYTGQKGPRISDERREILDVLRGAHGLMAKQVAEATGKNYHTTRRILQEMKKSGQVFDAQGFYFTNEDDAPQMA